MPHSGEHLCPHAQCAHSDRREAGIYSTSQMKDYREVAETNTRLRSDDYWCGVQTNSGSRVNHYRFVVVTYSGSRVDHYWSPH